MSFDFAETNINGSGSLKVFSWSGTSQNLLDDPVPARFANSANQSFIARCTDGTYEFVVNEDATALKLISGTSFHFGAFTIDTIPISDDPDDPTYLSGVTLFGSSSDEFSIFVAPDGSQLIRNDSNKTFSMQGSATYQLVQGIGGGAEFFLWSESTFDDGVTFEENAFSLRTSDVPNNIESSQTKSAAVGGWLPGQAIRWAMYKGPGGTITIASPSTTVNSGNAVSGFAFYWQLNEV